MRAPEFWRRDGLAPALLAPLGWGVDLAGRARRRLARTESASAPVICVGNLVAGGAGKTPTALALGTRLAAMGWAPHFLTRGYGGRLSGPVRVELGRHSAAEVGDEALLLAARAPTWVAADRPRGARAAAEAGARVIVMDDGFQNPALAKTLSLIVIDAGYGFGNGRVMPAGPLREDAGRGLARGQAVVLVGGEADAAARARIEVAGLPVLRARIEPEPEAARALAGKRVLAFAGIGRPEKLFATLEALGCELAARRAFPDHHRYSPDEIMALAEAASDLGAVPVTTEKDAARLPEAARAMIATLPVRLTFDDEDALDRLLARALLGRRE